MAYDKNEPASIQAMFDSIAKNYDRANAILSFQMHRLWNAELVRQTAVSETPDSLLDLCCGTGEIAFTYLRNAKKPCHAYLLDFSQEMLACSKDKASHLQLMPSHQLSYLQADAQAIPLPNNSIACVTMAYGIRNIKNPIKCLQETYRVLRPGGTFGILELTQPTNPLLRVGHKIYLNALLPLIGRCLTSNSQAYKYLCQSIQTFIQPSALSLLISEVGFQQPVRISLSKGIATILIAKKTN